MKLQFSALRQPFSLCSFTCPIFLLKMHLQPSNIWEAFILCSCNSGRFSFFFLINYWEDGTQKSVMLVFFQFFFFQERNWAVFRGVFWGIATLNGPFPEGLSGPSAKQPIKKRAMNRFLTIGKRPHKPNRAKKHHKNRKYNFSNTFDTFLVCFPILWGGQIFPKPHCLTRTTTIESTCRT